MANPWFRVWGDMVNDPKWRTIARRSGQKIGDVIAVYLHMLTCASNASERGRTEGWNDEDVATALDIEIEQVEAIREAMQGRVLDGDYLTGWEKRQPLREDEGGAARAKAWREAQKAAKEQQQTQANATERKQTLDTDKSREEEKREEETKAKAPAAPKQRKPVKTLLPEGFAVSEAVRKWAASKGYDRVDEHFESFVRKAKANGYTYADWDQALQNAIADDWAKLRVAPPRVPAGRPQPNSPAQLSAANEEAKRLLFGASTGEVIDV